MEARGALPGIPAGRLRLHVDLFGHALNQPHGKAVIQYGLPAEHYGGQEAVNQPGGPVIGYLDTREYSVSTLNAVGPSYLHLSQNPATGNGGTCYGDSTDRPAVPREAFPALTDREREMLHLMGKGASNAEIARLLSLSPKTVANYVSNILHKLQVADRKEAALRAREAGLGQDKP